MSKNKIESAHQKSRLNKLDIQFGKLCGCFYCRNVYSPNDIIEWCDGGETALCPKCGIDSVLPDSFPINDGKFLKEMYDYWFGRTFEMVKDELGKRGWAKCDPDEEDN